MKQNAAAATTTDAFRLLRQSLVPLPSSLVDAQHMVVLVRCTVEQFQLVKVVFAVSYGISYIHK